MKPLKPQAERSPVRSHDRPLQSQAGNNLAAPVAVRLPETTYRELLGIAELAHTSIGKVIREKLNQGAVSGFQLTVGETTTIYSLAEIERAAEAALKAKHAQRIKASAEKQHALYLFNKTSNNINQLAHRANLEHQTGVINAQTYHAILDALDTLKRDMKALLQALA